MIKKLLLPLLAAAGVLVPTGAHAADPEPAGDKKIQVIKEVRGLTSL